MASTASSSSAVPSLLSKSHVINPRSGSPTGVIIWLHGLGDSSEGFRSLFEQFSTFRPQTKIILPNAPTRPITANGGYRMQGWYDIVTFAGRNALQQKEDVKGIEDSVAALTDLIDYEAKAVGGAEKIVLGGFSQGGALTMRTGMWYREKLAGLYVASGYMLQADKYKKGELGPHATTVPIRGWHGEDDDVVPFAYSKMGYDKLKEVGVEDNLKVNFEDGLTHSMSDEEIKDVFRFCKERLP